MHAQHRAGNIGTRAHRTSRLPANGPTRGPRGRNLPETARRDRSTSALRGSPVVRDRAPWVRSGTGRARRPAARWREEEHTPRSDGDFRSRGSRGATRSFHGSVSTRSETARTGRRERATPAKAAPMARSRARRAAGMEAAGPVRAAGAARCPLLHTDGTDPAATTSRGSRARRRSGGNDASFARDRPPPLPQQKGRCPRSSQHAQLQSGSFGHAALVPGRLPDDFDIYPGDAGNRFHLGPRVRFEHVAHPAAGCRH